MTRLFSKTAWVLALVVVGLSPAPGARAAADPATVSDVSWLTGCWVGEGGEECWLAPLGGTMIGINRGPGRVGKPPSFEFLRIVDEGGKLVYLASPSGRFPPTPFEAIEVGHSRVVFANPEHDFPQRITYWREEEDGRATLHARVEARANDAWDGFEMHWEQTALSAE